MNSSSPKNGSVADRVDNQPLSPDANLINEDIKPAGIAQRTWSVMNMASLWIGMVVCVPTYMLAASLIEQGMNWKQAVATVMLGNIIVLIPMVLNGHPGTKYGIPFPVLARASFGIYGAAHPFDLASIGGMRLVRHSNLGRRFGNLPVNQRVVRRGFGGRSHTHPRN